MKTIVSILVLAVATLGVSAQNHNSRSFLNVQAIRATNTFQFTNFLTAGSVGTNKANTYYTNNNALVVVTAAGAGSQVNPFRDVSLWARRDGAPAVSWIANTNAAVAAETFIPKNDATLSVAWQSGSGANAAVTFLFTPLYNGEHEATAAAEEWSFSFTATASSRECLATNVPLHKWLGAEKLRLRRVVNADTDASSDVHIFDISLNGYVP